MRCESCEPDYCACADFYAGRMHYWKGELMNYDQITRDLAVKAGEDVCSAIHRTMALVDDPASKTMIAIMAAGQAFAIPAGALAAKLDVEPDKVVDVLIERIRPIILDAIKDLPR
jgi:hypothetical protein